MRIAHLALASFALTTSALAQEIALDDVRIAAGEETAIVSEVPWSGSWWPFASCKLALGWHGSADFSYDAASGTFTAHDKPDHDLAPLRKYDLWCLRRFGQDPGAARMELEGDAARGFEHHVYGAKKAQYDRDGVSYGWWGHCNGWAAAAVMEREPVAALTAEGIRFDAGDLKGLLTESYWGVRSQFTGRRYNRPDPALRAQVDRGAELLARLDTAEPPPVAEYVAWYEGIYRTTIDPAVKPRLTPQSFKASLESVREWARDAWEESYRDIYPHVFHKILVTTIKNKRLGVVFDTAANEEVWNFPAWRYTARITHLSDLAGGQRRWAVETTVAYAHDGVSESILGVNELTMDYTYELTTDAEGRPIDGTWTGASVDDHPDFAWLPTFNPTGEDRGENPNLLYGRLKELLAADNARAGARGIELQARTGAGELVGSRSRVPAGEATTWTHPLPVRSPVAVQVRVAAGVPAARVRYSVQAVDDGWHAVVRRDGLTLLAEAEAGADGAFAASLPLTARTLLVAQAFDAAGALLSQDELALVPETVQPPPPQDDRFEENDGRAAAAAIPLGLQADLRCNDEDWFELTVPGAGELTVVARFRHAEGDLDLELFQATTALGRSDSTRDEERVTWRATAAGKVLVRVYGYAGARAAYALETAFVPGQGPDGDDALEPNDAREAARLLAAPQDLRELRIAGNDDWFAVDLPGQGRVSVTIRFRHADGDLDLHLVDATGRVIGRSEGTSDAESASFTAPAAGRVWVRVFGYRNARGPYTLELR